MATHSLCKFAEAKAANGLCKNLQRPLAKEAEARAASAPINKAGGNEKKREENREEFTGKRKKKSRTKCFHAETKKYFHVERRTFSENRWSKLEDFERKKSIDKAEKTKGNLRKM